MFLAGWIIKLVVSVSVENIPSLHTSHVMVIVSGSVDSLLTFSGFMSGAAKNRAIINGPCRMFI